MYVVAPYHSLYSIVSTKLFVFVNFDNEIVFDFFAVAATKTEILSYARLTFGSERKQQCMNLCMFMKLIQRNAIKCLCICISWTVMCWFDMYVVVTVAVGADFNRQQLKNNTTYIDNNNERKNSLHKKKIERMNKFNLSCF